MHAFSSTACGRSPLPEGALGRGQKTLVEKRISARHAHEAPSGRVSSLRSAQIRSANIAPSPAPAKRVRENACRKVGTFKRVYTSKLTILQSPKGIEYRILYTNFFRLSSIWGNLPLPGMRHSCTIHARFTLSLQIRCIMKGRLSFIFRKGILRYVQYSGR